MLNDIKIKAMVELAEYEEGRGREDLRLYRYTRGDFIALQLIKTFFFTTAGYGLVLGLVLLGNIEEVLNQIDSEKIRSLLLWAAVGYLALLGVYMVITFIRAEKRYDNAQQGVREYVEKLRRLQKL